MERLSLKSSKKFWQGIDDLIRGHGIEGNYEVGVYSVSEKEMRLLGKKWMNDNELHEVISWPLENTAPDPDGIWRLGDVVVYEGAKDVEFLVEHGVRHLLGEHHE